MKRLLVIAMMMGAAAWAENVPSNGNQNGRPPMEQGGGGPGRGGHRAPPPEALAACQGKSSGAACSFTGRRGDSVSGTCFSPDPSKPLACKPTNMPPPPQK